MAAVKKSGVPGVTWHKRTKKWMAYLYKNHDKKYLGAYKKLEDAIKARKEAEEKSGRKKLIRVCKKEDTVKKLKCRNRNCLLNENLFCGSPCRDLAEFTCVNMDVPKNKEKSIAYRQSLRL